MLAFFDNKIWIEPEGQIIFSRQVSKYLEIGYNFGLKFAATLNYFIDTLLAACFFKRFAYERVFVFQRKL